MLRALRHRDFLWYWYNSTTRSGAFGMQFLILGWLVLDLTEDSSSKLGLMIFLYGVPNLVFALLGGILADRIKRAKLMLTTQTAVTVVILVLAPMRMADAVEMWHVYTAALVLGILQALNTPARVAIISELVPREDILNAVALNQVVMSAGRILGPALAGWIIELGGIGPALYFNAGCYFLSALCLIPIKSSAQAGAVGKSTMLRDLVAGLSYVRSTPVVFTVIGIGLGMGFFAMPHIQVMPALSGAGCWGGRHGDAATGCGHRLSDGKPDTGVSG